LLAGADTTTADPDKTTADLVERLVGEWEREDVGTPAVPPPAAAAKPPSRSSTKRPVAAASRASQAAEAATALLARKAEVLETPELPVHEDCLETDDSIDAAFAAFEASFLASRTECLAVLGLAPSAPASLD
jgi:hypothetical protein